MKKLLVLIILGLFLFSCQVKEQEGISTVDIDYCLKNPTKVTNVNNQTYIPLETNQQSIIGQVDLIRYHAGNFLILDKKNHTIFFFDSLGQFTTKIDNYGRGPDQFQGINDFSCFNESVYVLDNKGRIFIYNQTGIFQQTIHLPFMANYFELINDTTIAFQDVEIENRLKYTVAVYSLRNEKILHTLKPTKGITDEQYPFFREKSLWLISSGVILFNYDFSNIVHQITQDNITKLFTFTSKLFPTRSEIQNYILNPASRQYDAGRKIFKLNRFYLHDNSITFDFEYEKGIGRIFLSDNKENHDCYPTYNILRASYNDSYISYSYPIYNRKILEAKINEQLNANESEILSDESNPVIIISKLKQNQHTP